MRHPLILVFRRHPSALPMPATPLLHPAQPVIELAAARALCGGLLAGIQERSLDTRVDVDFFDHQMVEHPAPDGAGHRESSLVDEMSRVLAAA